MDDIEKNWRSVSTTVSKEFYGELTRVASAQGRKIGTLVRTALRAFTSPEVLHVASANKIDVEQLMRKSAMLFMRVTSGKDENSLRDQIYRLTVWMEKLFFIICQKNERLMMQERQDVERRMMAFYRELAKEHKDLQQEAVKASELSNQAAHGSPGAMARQGGPTGSGA
jgi:hypothetical protein